MMQLGVIVPAGPEPGLLSPVFGVPKSDGSVRFVHDLRALNAEVPPQRFRMESLASLRSFLLPGDWLCKIDLSKAYWHVPVAPECRRWLRFLAPDGTAWEFAAMPFGLARAPRVFTKIMRPVVGCLRAASHRVLQYLDDFLIAGATKSEAEASAQQVVELLSRLGFLVNLSKCELVAAQRRVFLGVIVDTVARVLVADPDKLSAVAETARVMARRVRRGRHPTVLDVQRLLGSLRFLTWCVQGAKVRQVHLMTCLRLALRRQASQRRRVPRCILAPPALQELDWWAALQQPAGVSLELPPRAVSVEVDATDSMAGFQWRSARAAWTDSVPLPAEVIGRSSALRELAAIELAVCSALASPELAALQRPATVHVATDSKAAMGCLRRVYSSVPAMARVARRIWLAVLASDVELEVEFVPGSQNVLADGLSRYHTSALNESTSARWLLEWCCQRLHAETPTLDVFATASNAVLPRFVSWRPVVGATSVDAFCASQWDASVWMFPPTPLAMAAMREFSRRPEVRQALLIVPEWTTQPFWPHAMLLSHGRWMRLPQGAVETPATARLRPRTWCCFWLHKLPVRA
jgi:hypothetical protein